MAEAEWQVDVKIKPAADLHKAMAHLPGVVAALTDTAAGIAARAAQGHKEATYGIIVQNKKSTKRARALVHPTNNAGIHVELTQHAMLKAAAGAQHKVIPLGKQPTPAAQTISTREGDSAATVTADGTMTPASVTSALANKAT